MPTPEPNYLSWLRCEFIHSCEEWQVTGESGVKTHEYKCIYIYMYVYPAARSIIMLNVAYTALITHHLKPVVCRFSTCWLQRRSVLSKHARTHIHTHQKLQMQRFSFIPKLLSWDFFPVMEIQILQWNHWYQHKHKHRLRVCLFRSWSMY